VINLNRVFLIAVLVLFSGGVFAKECTPDQTLSVQKNSEFVLPSGCTLTKAIINEIEFHHSIAYGNTDKAFEYIDRHWYTELGADFTIKKVHILNLHGKYDESIELLNGYTKTKDNSYYTALSETHLRLGNFESAQIFYKKIEVSKLPKISSVEYELVKYELLYSQKRFKELHEQADLYLSKLMKNEGSGNAGLDVMVVTYALLGACKSKDDFSVHNFKNNMITMLNETFSQSSVYHMEVERVTARCA